VLPAKLLPSWFIGGTTAQTLIKQFKALPPKQRAQVAKFVVKSDDSWIPACRAIRVSPPHY
jgi:DNA-binding transcriptional regulator PaaX